MTLCANSAQANITVHITVYNDSDAWDQSHIQAYDEFLTRCEQNGVKVAVFHYPHCENTASGITDVIKGHLGPNGAIEFVGVHGTSHSIAGLPETSRRWKSSTAGSSWRIKGSDPIYART